MGRRSQTFVNFSPDAWAVLKVSESFWYETPEEIQAGLAWGKRKARLLRWVRREMHRQLTPTESLCLQMHYFRGMPITQIAHANGISPSSVQRALDRAIRKLRAVAQRSRMRETLGIFPDQPRQGSAE